VRVAERTLYFTVVSADGSGRMRVLVTGGAGFIGSYLVEGLVAGGHAVRVLDSLDPQVHGPAPRPELPKGVEFTRADVRDRAAVAAALDGIDAVFHCAAAVGVAQSLYKVEHYVDVNVRGTATLLDCLAERKPRLKKLLVPTSMTGYGEGVYRRPSDGALVQAYGRIEFWRARGQLSMRVERLELAGDGDHPTSIPDRTNRSRARSAAATSPFAT